jgi:hypothetical protein
MAPRLRTDEQKQLRLGVYSEISNQFINNFLSRIITGDET